MFQKINFTVGLICILLVVASSALRVIQPEQIVGRVNSPRHRRAGPVAFQPDYYIVHSATYPLSEGSNRINSTTIIDLQGANRTVAKIACLTSQYDSSASNDKTILTAFRSGLCNAVLLRAENSDLAGSDYFQRDAAIDQLDLNRVTIPVLEVDRIIPRDAWNPRIKAGEVVVVYIDDKDTSPHEAVYWSPAYIIAVTLIICLCFGNSVWAAKSLSHFVGQLGCRMVIPVVLLSLAVVGNLLRAAYLLMSFASQTGLVTYFISNIFLILSWPFNLVCTMLIFLYWNELITRAKAVPIVFLEKYRTAFVIFCVILFAALIFVAILASWLGIVCLVIAGIVIVVIAVVLIIASVRIGIRVRAQILQSPPSGRRQRLIRATNLIILSSIVLLLFVIAGFFAVMPLNAIWINGIGQFYMWFWLAMNSMLQIAAFTPKRGTDTSSTLSTESFSASNKAASQEGGLSKTGSSSRSV